MAFFTEIMEKPWSPSLASGHEETRLFSKKYILQHSLSPRNQKSRSALDDDDQIVYLIADDYRRWPESSVWEEAREEEGHPAPEGLIVNALGATLVALAVVIPLMTLGCR